jgi:hypothetical protein
VCDSSWPCGSKASCFTVGTHGNRRSVRFSGIRGHCSDVQQRASADSNICFAVRVYRVVSGLGRKGQSGSLLVECLEPRQHGDSAWSEAGQQQRLGPAILKELFSLFVLAAQRRVEFEKCQRSVQATNFSNSSRLNGLCHKYHAIMHLQQPVPGGIRTPNLLIRSQKLYPVELQALVRT